MVVIFCGRVCDEHIVLDERHGVFTAGYVVMIY